MNAYGHESSRVYTANARIQRSGAQAQSWLVSVLHGCMAHTYVAARSRASEVLSWHFIHTLLDLQFAAVLLRACFALAG